MKREFDDILKHALTPKEEPDFWLNQKILNQVKEDKQMKNRKMKRIPAVLMAVLVLGVGSITAVAAWKYLTPDEVAKEVEDKKLTNAFQSKEAIMVQKTQSGGGYNVTLLGIVSGKDITEYVSEHNGKISEDKTYTVTAIERSDGAPMAKTSEDAYGEEAFFVSPLIEGCNPNKYNAVTMHGGYQDIVEDGILYRISECDNVEYFADRRIYLCVSDGTFYNPEAYFYDEETGAISKNPDYQGLNVLFTLPLDEKKADPVKAKKYLRQLEKEAEESDDTEYEKTEIDLWAEKVTPENIEQYAKRLEDTIQVLTPDAEGYIHTEYELENGRSGWGDFLVSELFPEGKTGMSESIGYNYSEDDMESLLFETYTLNKDGTVTYAVYVPK